MDRKQQVLSATQRLFRFERNEAVKKVTITVRPFAWPLSIPHRLFYKVDMEDEETSVICTTFKNLRTLNDNFALEVNLGVVELKNFGVSYLLTSTFINGRACRVGTRFSRIR